MGAADETSLDVLLLHSPLVGPPSLAPLADVLEERGLGTCLPDCTGVAAEPRPTWMIDAVLAEVAGRDVDVVVAHSGAGAILPVVASAVRAVAAVFVDAVLPVPGADRFTISPRLRTMLDAHADDGGRLEPWLSWWDVDVVDELLPDPVQRAAIADACPRLPVRFYDRAVPLPEQWVPSGYVALGAGYRDELARAATSRWPCRSLDRTHLATVTHPDEVATAVLDVVEELRAAA